MGQFLSLNESMFRLHDVPAGNWETRVFATDLTVRPEKHLDCGVLCLLVHGDDCELYVRDGADVCHFGTVDGTAGTATATDDVRDVHIKEGKHCTIRYQIL